MGNEAGAQTVHFTSTDNHTQVHGVIWWPQTEEIRGVVQLVHGMAEHIMRYEPFALRLNDHGFVVCGHDHVGHGKSVDSPARWGHLPMRGGRDILVGDVGRMRALMSEKVGPSLPYFLFGHSMGSFVVRSYIARHGQGLAGAIICGTGHIPSLTSTAGNIAARVIGTMRKETHVSGLLESLSVGAYAKAIEHARTPLDWLSYNKQNVDDYIADKMCGFPFSAGGNAALTALTKEVCTPQCCAKVPVGLPLLYVAGDGDPVGDMGRGVRTSAQMARDAGSVDVTCTIYEHMRHEILNETNRDKVMADIATWMEERL